MEFTKKEREELTLLEFARKKCREINDELSDKIYDLQIKKKQRENLAYVGKCYKFTDHYSDSETWFIYQKFTSLDELGEPVGSRFYKDSRGVITFEASDRVGHVIDYIKSGKAQKITLKEFEAMKVKLLKEGGFI